MPRTKPQNLSRKFLSPALIAEEMGEVVYKKTSDSSESLELFLYNSLKSWGLLPAATKFPETGEIAAETAIYPMEELFIRQLIVEFKTPRLKPPSEFWSDAPTIAGRNNLPSHYFRGALNAYIYSRILEMGFLPLRGRHGVENTVPNLIRPEDGGIFPENNPLINRLIKEYFYPLTSNYKTQAERFSLNVSTRF